MSLPTLNWRKLPTRTLLTGTDQSSSTILNNIYDMLTGSLYFDGTSRVQGSGSAWQNVGRFITGSGTGSNTEAVYCYPPTQSIMSQSFIIAGRNQFGARSTGYFQASVGKQDNNLTGSAVLGSLYVACVKNAGAYTSWFTASNQPFGSGSVSTGFAPFAYVTLLTGSYYGNQNIKISIYESQEAIAVSLYKQAASNNNINLLAVAGAIVDPEQTTTSVDAEADNRLYGVAVGPFSGSTGAGIVADSHSSTVGFFGGSTSSTLGANAFSILTPQSTSSFNAEKIIFGSATFVSYLTISGKLSELPMTVIADQASAPVANNSYVGRIREIYAIRNLPTNLVLREPSGSIIGFTLGKSESSGNSYDTMLLNY